MTPNAMRLFLRNLMLSTTPKPIHQTIPQCLHNCSSEALMYNRTSNQLLGVQMKCHLGLTMYESRRPAHRSYQLLPCSYKDHHKIRLSTSQSSIECIETVIRHILIPKNALMQLKGAKRGNVHFVAVFFLVKFHKLQE